MGVVDWVRHLPGRVCACLFILLSCLHSAPEGCLRNQWGVICNYASWSLFNLFGKRICRNSIDAARNRILVHLVRDFLSVHFPMFIYQLRIYLLNLCYMRYTTIYRKQSMPCVVDFHYNLQMWCSVHSLPCDVKPSRGVSKRWFIGCADSMSGAREASSPIDTRVDTHRILVWMELIWIKTTRATHFQFGHVHKDKFKTHYIKPPPAKPQTCA